MTVQSREDVRSLSDLEAEELAIAAVLGLPANRSDDLRRMLTAEDFFLPGNAALWSAAVEAVADGNLGPATVAGRIVDQRLTTLFGDEDGRRTETDRAVVAKSMYGQMMNQAEVLAAAARVAGKSAARRAWLAADHIQQGLMSGLDPEDVAREGISDLRSIRTANALPKGLYRTADIRGLVDTVSEPVIPGLINRSTRVVVVGFEGSGKSWLARQICELGAQGLHPFAQLPRFEPVTTLSIDLENPMESMVETMDAIQPILERKPYYDPDRAHFWHQPEGADIRTAAGYADMTAILREVKPDLVAIGPAYHMSRKLPREDDETFATSTLNILSDLRVRFRFGLILEHHAPHGSGGASRELRPFGSSAWLRWPEIGIGLRPDGPPGLETTVMRLERWRGDRVRNEWPARIARVDGGMRPWMDARMVEDRP